MHGLRLSPFSPLHHVGLPSLLMNLDVTVLTVGTPKTAKSVLLNRSLSTAVSSPRSTPPLTPKGVVCSNTVRSACLIASLIRSWRENPGIIGVIHVTKTNDYRPLVVVRRRSFDECLLAVGGIAVYIGPIDSNWVNKEVDIELDASSEQEIVLADLYTKVLAAARISLNCINDRPCISEIIASVSSAHAEMNQLLSAAIMLNDIRDDLGAPNNDCHIGLSRSVSHVNKVGNGTVNIYL